MNIKMEFNWETLIRGLRDLELNDSDMRGFVSDWLDIVKDHTDDIFKSEGAKLRNHNRWKQLDPKTKKARNRRRWYYKQNPSNPWILRRTGNLQDNTTKMVGTREGTLTWNAEYAKYHLNWPNKRVFIELDEGSKADIVREAQKRMEEEIQKFNNTRI